MTEKKKTLATIVIIVTLVSICSTLKRHSVVF